jgi:hypothetical protein
MAENEGEKNFSEKNRVGFDFHAKICKLPLNLKSYKPIF